MIRYGNDLELTALARSLANMHGVFAEDLTNGRLDHAFMMARAMQKRLDDVMARLNGIKWPAEDHAG